MKRIEAQEEAYEDFMEGVIPDDSPLYEKITSYQTRFKLLFMECKINPLVSEVTYKFKMGPGFELKITEDNLRNTTTYSGGVSVELGSKGMMGNAGKVSISTGVLGEMVVDGNGNVLSVDLGGKVEGQLTTGSNTVSVAYETSVMRGNRFTAEVSKSFNYDMFKIGGDVSQFLPNKKTVLWKGEYILLE